MSLTNFTRREYFDEQQYRSTLAAGIGAVKADDKTQARILLQKAAEMKPEDPQPWIWLSAATTDPREQKEFLENALAADPNNSAARRGLILLSEKLDKSRLLEIGQELKAHRPQEPEDAQAERVFRCEHCGGSMKYDIPQQVLVCESCGKEQRPNNNHAADTGEQVLDFILPTTRGHRWAEAQHRLTCAQCGAITLLNTGERATECAFCGSRQMIESAETIELVDPSVIAVAKYDGKEAAKQISDWLGRGLFIPDDLKKLAKASALRSAYYPFWTFDGTCQVNWVCEVNEGSSDSPHWVTHRGTELEMFDDVLIPGLKNIDQDDFKQIEPFDLKDVVEFDPAYLAGWNALAYNHPLSKASLDGREKVIKKLRRELRSRIYINGEIRNLNTGEINWSGMTFKYVLLPVWMATYKYHKKDYRVLVNGQTGKVGGEKPTDNIKVFAFSLLVFLSIAVLLLALYALSLNSGWVGLPE